MNKYELIYIIDTAVEEEARKALIEKYSAMITDNGGQVDKIDEWGKRRLAYAINDKLEGYYVLVNFQSEPEMPREIDRTMRINESILRCQIIKVEDKKHSVKPRAVRPAAPAAEEVKTEEAPVEAPVAETAETPAE